MYMKKKIIGLITAPMLLANPKATFTLLCKLLIHIEQHKQMYIELRFLEKTSLCEVCDCSKLDEPYTDL